MRVAVVGPGALGSVYGARLALLGGCEVDLVARTPAPGARLDLVPADGRGDSLAWSAPASVASLPAAADVALVCVRYEQLDGVVAGASQDGCRAPLVFLTPMMPQDHARLSAALPGRVVVAMPSVIAYHKDGATIRYWHPRSATSWLGTRPGSTLEADLAASLERAGFRAKLDADVLARNVATTVSFMPLAIGLDVAGGIDRILADDALLALALRATEEGRALGRGIGKAEAWASTILAFARPFLLRAGVSLARSRSPEALAYVDQHFGKKLHAQNVAMGARIVALAKERRVRCEALERLVARL